jgi:FtsH-binding integral membrane protein
MQPQGLNPGDRVVELAALASSAAIVTGAVAGALVAWLIKKSWLVSLGAFFAGAALGFVVAQVVVRVLYRSADGHTAVVKVGSASLTSTIPAGLAGGVTMAVLVAGLALLLFGAESQAASLFGAALGCGVALGVLLAGLSSLTWWLIGHKAGLVSENGVRHHFPLKGASSMLESDVFSRTKPEGAIVSGETYNLVIGLVLCWGFLMNWLIVHHVSPESITNINPWIFFIAYFASCFFGAYLFNSSSDPAISFIGYNFVVVPFGLVVNVVVSRYEPNLVLEAIQLATAVTIIMMFLGSLHPKFFEEIYGALVAALLAVIVIELLQIFVFHHDRTWIDWAVVIIFCGLIGFDWGRANRIPKTVDNAVDSAAALYMDIINVFLRLLRILGRKW